MMTFSIRFSSIKIMLELFEKLISNKVQRQDIENILNHEDYQFEFERYEGRISKNEYINYLLELNYLEEKDIANIDLKAHHSYYVDLFNNIDYYKEKLSELEELLTPDLFKDQTAIALKGLPDHLILPNINFIFTIGIGQSFGYINKNCAHFDFLQLAKDKSLIDFSSTIAHEIHHIGIDIVHNKIDFNKISLESLFYLYFSGEGLAVKYCNNAQGVLSKSIYNGPKNKGLDSYTWDYLNNDFYNTMTQFRKTIDSIRNNAISSVEELNKHIFEYWMNPYTNDQDKSEIPKLKHFRLYSFGNDIWGIIHDCFGKNVVFDTLQNPENFPDVFNNALDKIGYSQFKILLIC